MGSNGHFRYFFTPSFEKFVTFCMFGEEWRMRVNCPRLAILSEVSGLANRRFFCPCLVEELVHITARKAILETEVFFFF